MGGMGLKWAHQIDKLSFTRSSTTEKAGLVQMAINGRVSITNV